MNIILFFITIIISFVFSSMLSQLLPGGDADLKIILGIVVFITGEIAVCTNIVVKKLDEFRK